MRLDLQPIVMWGRDAPYTFTNVPPGAHQLTVELVNNDHTLFSPPVVRQLNFRTRAPTLAVMPNTGNDALLVSAWRTLLLLLAGIVVALGWGVRGKRAMLAPLPLRNRNR